jgi:hypothetical protein
LAKENLFTILLLLGKTRDAYLDTKKRRTSKTVKTKSFWSTERHELRSTITPQLAKIIR